MTFTARLESDILKELRFQTYGCAPAIACGSFLAKELQGRKVHEISAWTVERLVQALGGLPSDKVSCAVLGVMALQDLLTNIQKAMTDPHGKKGLDCRGPLSSNDAT